MLNMTFTRQSIVSGLLAVLLGGLVPAAAVAEDMPQRGPMSYAVLDRDGNGFVTEEEFLAMRQERLEARMAKIRARCEASSARMFSWLDTDDDGLLSPAELEAWQSARMERQRRTGMGYGPNRGRGMGMMRNRPTFTVFDINADGVITEEEFYTARNNRIKARMEQGYRMRNLPNAPTFADLDTDGDGEISAEEFAAHQHMGPWGRMP
jgi:Ca2+-binding EF-hand superfamily protein